MSVRKMSQPLLKFDKSPVGKAMRNILKVGHPLGANIANYNRSTDLKANNFKPGKIYPTK